MTDEDKRTSRKVLENRLFLANRLRELPATDEQARMALIAAMLPIVGGADGLWAAVELLKDIHFERS